MKFLDEARAVLHETLPEIQERTGDYVPRILVREGTSRQDTAQLRSLRRLAIPDLEGLFLDDAQITSCPRVAIIGDAGSGKSYVLQNAYLEAARVFLRSSDAPLPCFLDLARHLSIRRSLEEALNRRYQGLFGRLRSEHEPGCVLFLDALDERLSTEENPYDFINEILSFLKSYQYQLSSVVLACRRALWNANWFRNSVPPWDVYHTDHLDREDYTAIIPDLATRRDFFKHANSLGIADLLRLPFIGFDLARKYGQGEDLPSSRQDWFQERIKAMLKGSERDQERGQAPPLGILLDLARQLACLATFGRVQTWTIQEAVDQLGASKVLQHELEPITYEQVQTLFQRPLFTKTDERFSFCHQLFREHLAAEALSPLPLRKQRQLLESPLPSLRHRILPPHRGVAIYLAEMSSKFRDHLIENEPLLVFLGEHPSLSRETDERLTKAVIDEAITTHRPYWWGIPPRGERPGDALPKHRPRDVTRFVRPYLERSDEMSLLWATACTEAWGGSASLNDLLIDLAHDDKINVEIRKNAVEAVLASGERKSIQELYDLLDSEDDQVRGHALYAYRITESPTPKEYISKLHGGASNDRLRCLLQLEASSFGLSLDAKQLRNAFQEVCLHFGELGNLRCHVLQGLFSRAVELGFYSIPPSLIVKSWQSRDAEKAYYREALKELISSNESLFAEIWNYVMDGLGRGNRGVFHVDLHHHFAEACDDGIFDLLPAERSTLNRHQEWLIRMVLWGHFMKEPTSKRLQEFRERTPAFTIHFQLPRPKLEPSSRDPLESRSKIVDILNRGEAFSHAKASQILRAAARIARGDDDSWAQPAEVVRFLKDLSAPLQKRVLEVFEACVFQLEYSCTQADQPSRFTMTAPEVAVPFWVLWNRGFKFPADKLDEFIRCYAFSGFPIDATPQLYFPLLDALYDLDRERWSNTVVWLVEAPHTSLHGALEYLVTKESNLYVQRCRQRLCQCDFDIVDLTPLLDYWVARRPPDFEQVLRTCYGCVDSEDKRTALLYTLLTEDDDWAWDELHRCIEAETAPSETDHKSARRPLQLHLNPSRLPILADWYAYVRRNEEDNGWPGDLGPVLLEIIVRIGGEDAIEQLRRLQDEKAFPGVEWLSHAILRVEDEMLGMPSAAMEPGQLLDFVNREAIGVVLNEHDLFEWVCQAIEDEKKSLEKQGDQVHGYWNYHKDEWSPKQEPQCQNVLWPRIRSRLSSLGIVGVEERLIRADRVDFWVEKPLKEGHSLRVAVELKVARKGYGHKRLVAPLQTQLWRQYLEPSECRHGIYVVLWFKDSERYPYPTKWATPQGLTEELSLYKHEITERHHVDLACYVIDMTTATRLH
jgi:hypothetical protein